MSFEKYGRNTILIGPWGGQDGFYWDDGVYSTIRQIQIAHGAGVDSIRIEYDSNGKSVWSEKHGGKGGAKIDKIRLAYPEEYLVSLQGHYGSMLAWGPAFIRSLTFVSNKRKYGPYGVEQGTFFTYPPTHGKIVGFLGKAGCYLDSIGAYSQSIANQHIAALVAAPTAVDSVFHSQKFVAHAKEDYEYETDGYEYSMVQESLGPDYDLIFAVRRKDGKMNYPNYPLVDLLPKTSHDNSHTEHKNESIASVVPTKIEEIPFTKAFTSQPIENFPSKSVKRVVTLGPWGGTGGTLFDDGVYDGIRQINVKRSVGIVSIRVFYDKNGQFIRGLKNGGTGSFKTDKVIFDYPSEILTHITGYHGWSKIMGREAIKSLTFHTTRRKYGPYGEEQGQFFSTKLKEGSMIVGFHGKTGLFVDAIGVHVLEGKVAAPAPSSRNKPNQQTALALTNKVDSFQWPFSRAKQLGPNEEVGERMVKDPAPFGPGPWGGKGGKPWDDGVFTGIKQIVLTRQDAICSIEIEYDRNGQSVWSIEHGGMGGHTSNRVKLDYPHEVLTCISGYYGPNKSQGAKVIQSLTFHTSRRKYGPFGEEVGTYFASGTTEGKVVGFHGRSSMYLDAIGVHMQHWLGNSKLPKPSIRKYYFS